MKNEEYTPGQLLFGIAFGLGCLYVVVAFWTAMLGTGGLHVNPWYVLGAILLCAALSGRE